MNVWRIKSIYKERIVEVEGECDEEGIKERKEDDKAHVGREW